MATHEDLAAVARRLIDAHAYLTLATADEGGRPWASPVFYSAAGYSDFYWVSVPAARHSRNLADRPEVAIVIFDSRVPVGGAQAVYLEARAEEVPAAELPGAIEMFSRGSQARGAPPWAIDDVRAHAAHRLYRARASACSVLDGSDERAGDWRTEVAP
jgi:nitroimidazol reductase NimA-like FMN-containing flavoprotein (pyridoxamine 5'-phosphate oxidase superfamily)